MRGIWLGLALILATLGSMVMAQSSARDAMGDWRATISFAGTELRLALHLGDKSTFDSLDQGAFGLPARMALDGDRVIVTIDGVGVIEGTISADGREINGALRQGAVSMPVRFERGVFTASRRPQTPRPPFPYRSLEVDFRNPRQANLRLAGTMTLPGGKGPFPAVILISGSGSQDRDGTLFDHKPFLILADALTRRGIAVLRVDDRGVGGSDAGPKDVTSADLATDVEAGIAWLRSREEIDESRIGLLGHSEGATIASMVASKDPAIDFLLLWAGQGMPGDAVLVAQARAIAMAGGAGQEEANRVATVQRSVLTSVVENPDATTLRSSLDNIAARHGAPPLDGSAINQLTSVWYRHFLTYDPAPTLRKVRIPVLALLGGRDVQVTPDENGQALRAALGGNPRARVEVLPGLNHLFQSSQTGHPDEYKSIEQTIAAEALARMVNWIAEQTSPAAH